MKVKNKASNKFKLNTSIETILDEAKTIDLSSQEVKKAWLHDILVCADMLQTKRPPEYRFMYNSTGFWYFNSLIKYCKALKKIILEHNCNACPTVDKIVKWICKNVRFIGDLNNLRSPVVLDYPPKYAFEALAEFFAANNLKWKCTKEDAESLNSEFFEKLKQYNCINII